MTHVLDVVTVDRKEGHSKNKYPWNTRGPVHVISVRPVGTNTYVLSHEYQNLLAMKLFENFLIVKMLEEADDMQRRPGIWNTA